jgi:preprotein translocase subunit YajC
VFISSAYAQAGPAGLGGEGGMGTIIMFVMMGLFMYFLIFRPQQKKQKEHRNMVDALQKGDEVVAAGGLVGKITAVSESYITLEVAPGTEIRAQKFSVQTLLPKGTLKSI